LVVLSQTNRPTKLPYPVDRPETRPCGFLFAFAISTTMTTHYRQTHASPQPRTFSLMDPAFQGREFDLVPCYQSHLRPFRPPPAALAFLHSYTLAWTCSTPFAVILLCRRSSSLKLHPMNGPSYSLIETPCFFLFLFLFLISTVNPFHEDPARFPFCGSISVSCTSCIQTNAIQATRDKLEGSVNCVYDRTWPPRERSDECIQRGRIE